MRSYPFAAARVFGTPLAIHPTKGQVIAQALAGRIAGVAPTPLAGDDDDSIVVSIDDSEGSYDLVRGVAVIPVSGTLVHKASYLDALCGMRGYDAIRRDFLTALDDPEVRAICFAVDSPGGEVSGCFDLVDLIYSSRGKKRMWAILDDAAYSAAYAIASAADYITVPRTGGTGSVGVICMHADFSRQLKGEGIGVTLITYGDHKADGNPYNPLDKAVLQRIQADVDKMGELFVETVARNRNKAPEAIRATQASTYMGAAGVDVGFADAEMAPDEAFRTLLSELGT
jgi:ClpP class serine protease